MDQKTMIVLIVGIFLLVATVQGLQLNKLKNKMSDDSLELSATATKSPAPRTSASLPSSVKELPQMVGGC